MKMKIPFGRALMSCLLLLAMSGLGVASGRRQGSAKSTFTVNTTELGRGVRGYRGAVPVAVTFVGGRISEIKILPNYETPAYFRRVEQSGITAGYIGLTAAQAAARKVDGCSGATMSSRALIENIRIAAVEAQKRR